MHVVVCIKQVPDTAEIRIDPKTGTMQRAGVPSIVNPYDVHALEEAMRLKDRFGGKVTAITMGPPQAKEALKEAITFGVDEGILLTDRGFAGADTLATSYALWLGIKKVMESEPVDLVICGKQAIDGDTAQVPPGIARRLGWPQLTYVCRIESIDPETREIRVQRVVEGGREVVRSRLPAVLSVVKEINEPRYASLKDIIRAARYNPIVWDRSALGADETQIGLRGSPTIVAKVWAPTPRQRPPVKLFSENGSSIQEQVDRLVDDMLKLGIIQVE